jgi:PD-(D/E)XK nuclease superfamily
MKQTLILDSSQIDTYLTCPQLWRNSYKDSLTKTDLSDKEAIAMGTLGHKWLEFYYQGRALGKPIGDCVAAANALDPDTMDNEPNDNHKFPLNDEKRKIVKSRMQEYWMTYSQNDYIPDYKLKYEIGISSTTGLPFDAYSKVPLIEQGFSYKLLETPEYLFILEGRIDFIGTYTSQQFFMDHKLQIREHKLYPKSIQFKNYALATGLNLGIINYIRLHKETSNKTFVREPIGFNPYEIKRWRSELINTYVEIANAVKHDEFDYRWSSCSGKFGYACEFAEVCEEPNIGVANLIKIQNFKKKKEWKPW